MIKNNSKFLTMAKDKLGFMRDIRRNFHRHPELGMQEHKTAELIAEVLRKLGIEVKTGIGGTGVVGLLKGNSGNKTVALRADIDALPMEDQIEQNYVSEVPGVAHSCGHDGHIAIQIGAAMILSSIREKIPGNIKFIFQPSEDTIPGGAVPMIEDGVLHNPEVNAIFSLHLYPLFKEGTAVVKAGTVSLTSLSFNLTISGRGGHIAMPHKIVNPILLSALVISHAESVLPKGLEPGEPIIFDFGSIHGGTVGNIIPSEVNLKGNIRISSTELMNKMTEHFEKLIKGIVISNDGSYTLELLNGYPPIVNNTELSLMWKRSAEKVLGKDRVFEYDKIMPIGDDVAYFHQHVPGVYWWLGTKNEKKGYTNPLHSPKFDFNEDVMAIGAAIQAQAALDFLSIKTSNQNVK